MQNECEWSPFLEEKEKMNIANGRAYSTTSLIPLIPKRLKTIFLKIVWGFLVGRRRAGSGIVKPIFLWWGHRVKLGKVTWPHPSPPLVCPTDDIHTLPGREKPSLGTGGVHSSLQPLLMLCGWGLPGDGLPTSRFSTLLQSIFPAELELDDPST